LDLTPKAGATKARLHRRDYIKEKTNRVKSQPDE
jgi:hypothetical protein